MYTLEQLKDKSLKELKEIGWELNVLPEGDRRYRQNWIDAIAGVTPPLMQLLETSPGEVQSQEPPIESKFGRIVYPRPTQGAIVQAAETSPGLEVEQAHEPISQVAKTPPGVERTVDYLDCPSCGAVHGLYATKGLIAPWEARCIHCDYVKSSVHHPFEYTRPFELPLNRLNYLPITEVAKTSPVKVDPGDDESCPKCVECFDDGFVEEEWGLIRLCQCSKGTPSAIAPAAKNLPGSRSKTSTAHQLLELFKSSAHIIEDFPGVKTEVTVSESAIAPAVKTSFDAEPDLNPISTGIVLSDRFLARYSPPQSEALRYEITDSHKVDADGQLSLFAAQVVTEPEPPDPDDYESLDAFRQAIALWDAQNLEPLDVSLDSMCEWAPCPEEWYEPKAEISPLKASSMIELPKQPEVMELSTGSSSSVTRNFSIPVFDAWCDRSNGSDEPPDTGTFARLRGPKPPKFPPREMGRLQVRVNQGKSASQASRNYPDTIPILFRRVAAGSSAQPARSPPGGDA